LDLKDKYFAAVQPEDIGNAIFSRISQTVLWKNSSEVRRNYAQAYMHSYASVDMGAGKSSILDRGGEEGELSQVRVNTARSTERGLLGLLLGPRINWRPTARNSQPETRAAIRKATGLLEFMWKTKRVSRVVQRWIDQGLRYGEAFLHVPWDWSKGPEAGPGMFKGDISFTSIMPWHVFRDDTFNDFGMCPWLCVREFSNRYDYATLYPRDIKGEPTIDKFGSISEARAINQGTSIAQGSDVVPLYYFYHRKTPAMPMGRQVVCTGGGVVLRDSAANEQGLAYDRVPVIRFAPEEMDDTAYGTTPWHDTLGIQEEMDGLESSIASNQLTFGTQSISMVEGTVAKPDDVAGMKVFYHKAGQEPPKPLQLTASPKEIFTHLDRLKGAQRDILGLNDVSMGDPDTAQMNAAAFQILAGMANQRNAPLQAAVVDAVGELGSHVLALAKRYFTEERQIMIAGRDGVDVPEKVSGKDLEPIDDTIVEVGNALESSVAGRVQLSNMYADLIRTLPPQVVNQVMGQLQQIQETGRLEPMTDPMRDATLLTDAENEQLAQGINPPVHFLDDAPAHAQKHWAVLCNVIARGSPKVVKAVHDHISAHYVEFFALPPPMDPATGQPAIDPATGQPAQPNPMADPQYPMRIRFLLGQAPPPGMMPPPMPGAPGPGGSGGPSGQPAPPPNVMADPTVDKQPQPPPQ